MRHQLSAGRARRWATRSGGVLVAAVLAVGIAPGAASAAPTNPTDGQIATAQTARDQAAAQVGTISAQLAGAQASADAAHRQAQVALQDYEDTQAAAAEAQVAADAAAAASTAADVAVDQGRADVGDFARSSYMDGSTSPGFAALITSGSPTDYIERAALLEAAGTNRTDVLAQLTVLQGAAEVAETQAAESLTAATALQTQAEESLASAQAQESSARAQADALAAQTADLQAQLTAAQQTLYGLEGARQVAQQQAAAARAAAAAVPARPAPASTSTSSSSTTPRPSATSSTGSSSGSSSSGSSSPGSSTSAPTGGTAGAPSASAASTAISAARSQIGVLYSWGGGGANGPSYGISPDTSVYGFDCSGLTEYAYARAGIRIGGTSRAQWWNNRNKQVDAGSLQPGDLLFWGSDGSDYLSIYHVAIYVGNNRMVEAPDRGQRVQERSVYFGSTFFGAVRPSA